MCSKACIARATTTPAPCGMTFVDNGYCFPSQQAETPNRIGGWTAGTLEDAQAACCQHLQCMGVHWDSSYPDYVLLTAVGNPNGETGRQCWRKPTVLPTRRWQVLGLLPQQFLSRMLIDGSNAANFCRIEEEIIFPRCWHSGSAGCTPLPHSTPYIHSTSPEGTFAACPPV
eukprot:gene9101-biopygen12188